MQTTEEFTEAYNACATESCRQEIEALNAQASADGMNVIKQLATEGKINRDDYLAIVSTILPKMAQGDNGFSLGGSLPLFSEQPKYR